MSSAAVSRLSKEYRALLKKPLVGAAAAPLEDEDGNVNLFTWKAVVVAQAPYDFPVRIHLDYGEDYPNIAPKAYFETPISFVGGASYTADNGLQAVCLNIFGNFAAVHDEWAQQQSGWTPAYTIETILTSVQALLMDSGLVSFQPTDIANARQAAESFKCGRTGHSGAKKEEWWPAVRMELMDDKEEEGGSDNGSAEAGATAPSWTPEDETDYICYVTKECPVNLKLGFGVGVEGGRVKSFTSPCELMSLEAFTDLKVRASSTNKPFQVWTPVMTPFQSWVDVRDAFHASVKTLVEMAGERYDANMSPIRVGTSIMNNLVVEVMNAKNQLTVNDKFIDGYYAFLRLLSYHVHERPAAQAHVTKKVKEFIESRAARNKAVTPNLGEFILYPLLTLGKYQWRHIADGFMRENDTRGVFWYAVGHHNSPAKYPELKQKAAPGRAVKVFDATEISRHLVCYQARFAAIAESKSMQVPLTTPTAMLPRHAGGAMVPEEVKATLKTLYHEITAITNWDGHFKFLGLKPPGAKRDAELVDALENALACGYVPGGEGGAGRRKSNKRGRWN